MPFLYFFCVLKYKQKRRFRFTLNGVIFMAAMTRKIDMVNGPLFKNLILFTIPIILTSALQLMFNTVDLIVAGRFYGADTLAAIGSTSSLTSLITNLFMGFSVAVSVAVSHSLGSGDADASSRVVHTAIPLAAVSGLLLTAIGLFGAEPILTLMDTDKTIINQAVLYMQIYFLGSVPMLIYNFSASVLRSSGDSTSPLIFLLISGIVNLMVKLLFANFTDLGIVGIALTTVISQTLSAVLVTLKLMRRNDSCKLNLFKMRFYKRELKKLLYLGIPASIQSSMFSLTNVFIQSAVNPFGAVFVSGNAAAGNIESFLNAIVHSFYQTSLNFTGQNVGNGNIKRIKKTFTYMLFTVTAVGLFVCLIVLFFSNELLSIYIKDSPEAIKHGTIRIMYVCIPYFLYGIMDTISGAIRGLGSSIPPTVISILGICVFRIVWQFTVFQIPSLHTPQVLFQAYTLSWLLTGTANAICFMIVYKRKKAEILKRKN